eukprot:6174754-Pleurochrysis_carterae.AAC.1
MEKQASSKRLVQRAAFCKSYRECSHVTLAKQFSNDPSARVPPRAATSRRVKEKVHEHVILSAVHLLV